MIELEVQILELIEKLNNCPNLRDENKLYKLLAKIEDEALCGVEVLSMIQ